MTQEEILNQMAAYKAEQKRLRQITTDICNAAQMLESTWLAFDAELVTDGAYEAALPAHDESMAKVPGTAEAIAGLRAALAQAVQIAQAMQTADPTIFPSLTMPTPPEVA